MSSQSKIQVIHKKMDEKDQIDDDYHMNFDKRHQIGEIQAYKI